ncbi:MAG: hypothetical protein NTZ33_15335 [Bacteroidetes bacterium]|nr:hypothetical protein [Bacteroidota bacterium]
MRKYIIIYIISLIPFLQETVYSQRIFLVEKPGTVNNLKFRIGDRIDLKTTKGERYNGIINQIRDTALIINYELVLNKDISAIYTTRALISMFSAAGISGGVFYIFLGGLTNIVDGRTPIINNSSLKTGGIIFATGGLLSVFSKRKRHIDNHKWRIKVLDFTIIKDPGIYANPEN